MSNHITEMLLILANTLIYMVIICSEILYEFLNPEGFQFLFFKFFCAFHLTFILQNTYSVKPERNLKRGCIAHFVNLWLQTNHTLYGLQPQTFHAASPVVTKG